MNLVKFLLWTTFGTAIWTSILAALGLVLGRNYERVSQYLGPISTVLVIGLIIAAVVWVVRRRKKAKRAHSSAAS